MGDELYQLVRHAEVVMGTVVSFAVRADGADCATTAVREAVGWLHDVDARFSPYRADSEVSLIDAGSLSVDQASADMRQVLDLCDQVIATTDGYFTIRPWGRFDPSGLVKGWAVQRAADILLGHGLVDHSVAGGGDVQVHGLRGPGRPWVVGITDPHRQGTVLSTLPLTDGAVATSGTAERGAHVVDPHTGRAARELASITLVGRELTWVDACATAALAMGRVALAWVSAQRGLEALAVDDAGHASWTDGWPGSGPGRT